VAGDRMTNTCAGCRTRPITSSVYFCTECCAAIRRSMRSAPASSQVEVRRLDEFARMVGAAALAEIAARDEAIRRLDTILGTAQPA